MVQAWKDLSRIHAAGMPESDGGNLIVNPGFERAPTDSGLDWHLRQEQFLDTIVVNSETGHALLLDFTVPQNTERNLVMMGAQ